MNNYPALLRYIIYKQFIRIQSLTKQDCHDKNYAPKHQFRRALCMEVFHAPSSAGRCHWNWLGSAPGEGWKRLVMASHVHLPWSRWGVRSQDVSVHGYRGLITGSTDIRNIFCWGGFIGNPEFPKLFIWHWHIWHPGWGGRSNIYVRPLRYHRKGREGSAELKRHRCFKGAPKKLAGTTVYFFLLMFSPYDWCFLWKKKGKHEALLTKQKQEKITNCIGYVGRLLGCLAGT